MNAAHVPAMRGAHATRSLLGVDFHALPARRAIDILDAHVRHRVPIKVAFANAHTLNTARVNPRYREVLQRFAVFNDGVGVDLASWLRFGERFPDNLNGTDFVPAYLERTLLPLRIFMLGTRPEVIGRAFEAARRRFPRHEWVGCRDGYFSRDEEDELLATLRAERIDLLLVGMGNPLQELWIDRCAAASRATACVGVGALLDFLAGEVGRAPAWVRRARLEWAWRLLLEPRRLWRRYLVGNATFLWHAWRERR
jgi:alpha-1,3-mannosyltransferase